MRGRFGLFRDGGHAVYLEYGEDRVPLGQVRVAHHRDGWIPVVQSPLFAYAEQILSARGVDTPVAADDYLEYRSRQFPELGSEFHASVRVGFDKIIFEAAGGQCQKRILGAFRDGLLFVSAGFHRCAAAAAAGHTEVRRSRAVRLPRIPRSVFRFLRHQANKAVPKRALLYLIRPIVARLAHDTTVTCFGKADGGGAQLHAVLSVAAFCRFFDIDFRHTPFAQIRHMNSDGWDLSRDYAPYWESQLDRFGFIKHSEESEPLGSPLVLLSRILLGKSRNRRFSLHHAHRVTNLIPEAFYAVGAIQQPGVRPTKTSLVCAVHARRGDVSQYGAESFRYSSNKEICAAINEVKLIYCDRNIKFQIILQDKSLANDELFKNYTVVATDNPIEAFDELVSADVLVLAKSSFSYAAGLLSSGHVFCPLFWHPPIPHWKLLPNFSG